MCAGIAFYENIILSEEIPNFFNNNELSKSRKGRLLESFYWQRRPFLPVFENDSIHLYEWGNRDGLLKMPKTGWARIESLRDGFWDYLSPKTVEVPCLYGYEKKKWFRSPYGLKAVKVHFHNIYRVYLITDKADQLFQKIIGHDRMPIGKIEYLSNNSSLNI